MTSVVAAVHDRRRMNEALPLSDRRPAVDGYLGRRRGHRPPLQAARCWLIAFLGLGMISATAKTDTSPAPAKTYSFTQCVQIALDHNSALQEASTQFMAAKGESIQLHAILYPTVNAQGLTTPLNFYIQVNQLIYTHATVPQLRLSRLTLDQASINYRQVLNDVMFQVRQAFIAVLAARDRADIDRQFADEKAQAVTATQQLFDAGKVQKSDVTNIQVQANISRQNLATDELTYSQAKIFLTNLLGQPLPQSARFVGSFATSLPDNLDTGKLTTQALQDREDLKLLNSLQLSADQQIKIDMKNAYPIVGFSSNSTIQPPTLAFASDFNAEANYNEPSTVPTPGDTQLPLSLYFTWIIFDGGNLRGVKISDQAKIASRDVAIEELKQSIGAEVAESISTIERQRSSLKGMSEQTKPEEMRRLAEASYEAGQIRQLDKVNMENTLLSQQLLQLDSQVRLCMAAAVLDHALGHSLKVTTVSP